MGRGEVDVSSVENAALVPVGRVAHTVGTRIVRIPRQGLIKRGRRVVAQHFPVGACAVVERDEVHVPAVEYGIIVTCGVVANVVSRWIEGGPG